MSDNNDQPITITEMAQQAPDLFQASEQFLAIEKYLEKALKP